MMKRYVDNSRSKNYPLPSLFEIRLDSSKPRLIIRDNRDGRGEKVERERERETGINDA